MKHQEHNFPSQTESVELTHVLDTDSQAVFRGSLEFRAMNKRIPREKFGDSSFSQLHL
jgi:hypothetical protein